MKKTPIRKMKQPVEAPVADDVIEQTQTTESRTAMAKKEMNAYTSYSNLIENKMGIGRNGKRALHGGIAAAGTWAAGHYGGVGIIATNMPTAIGIGAATGFLATVAADKLFIDDTQEFLLELSRVESLSEGSKDALREWAASDEAAKLFRKTG